jgi:hypothetical protein
MKPDFNSLRWIKHRKFFVRYTDKKDNQIFLIHKEIQSGAVAKSDMRKGKYFPIYEEAVSHIWRCNCSTLNFLIYGKFYFLFYQCRSLVLTSIEYFVLIIYDIKLVILLCEEASLLQLG